MTTAAATAIPARAAGRVGTWPSLRHSLPGEATAVLALYGLYELARGLVVGDTAEAAGTHVESLRSSTRCTSSWRGMCSALRTRPQDSPARSASPT
jgi:hypothetical protein